MRALGRSGDDALSGRSSISRTDPFRTVPVRLSLGHRSRRTAIFGLGPRRTRELALLLDVDGREHEVPSDGGVFVSAKLAEVLGVRPGDRISADVLEGEHRVRELPIVATVNDVSGINAYMELRAANRLAWECAADTGDTGATTVGSWSPSSPSQWSHSSGQCRPWQPGVLRCGVASADEPPVFAAAAPAASTPAVTDESGVEPPRDAQQAAQAADPRRSAARGGGPTGGGGRLGVRQDRGACQQPLMRHPRHGALWGLHPHLCPRAHPRPAPE